MGAKLAALASILGDGEWVLRGLNPKLTDAGRPTERNFMLKADDPLDDGPSFGICKMPEGKEAVAPLGVKQGIEPRILPTVLPTLKWGVARISVAEALVEVHGRVAFIQKDADDWGVHKQAHCMVSGHQALEPKQRNDLRRHLAKLASKDIPVAPDLS